MVAAAKHYTRAVGAGEVLVLVQQVDLDLPCTRAPCWPWWRARQRCSAATGRRRS